MKFTEEELERCRLHNQIRELENNAEGHESHVADLEQQNAALTAELERVQTLEQQVVGILGKHHLPNVLAIGEKLEQLTAQLRAAEQERDELADRLKGLTGKLANEEPRQASEFAARIKAGEDAEKVIVEAIKGWKVHYNFRCELHEEASRKLIAARKESTALREQLDQARQQCTELAKQAGLAQGELAASEMAGVVREWKERAERAEGELAKMRELEIIDGAYAELTGEMDRALEHFTETGDLKGTGKWRLDEIAKCLWNMKAIDTKRRADTESLESTPTAAAQEGE